MQEKQLVVFQGPSGVGKTHFMRFLIAEYGSHYGIVRSLTTREPREKHEHQFFDFLSDEDFDRRIAGGTAVPSGEFRGKRYGLTLDAAEEVLRAKHGLITLTDAGVAVYAAVPRLRQRLRIVEMVPDAAATIEDNLRRRGLEGQELADELARAEAWQRPRTHAGALVMRGVRNHLHQLAADLFRQLHP